MLSASIEDKSSIGSAPIEDKLSIGALKISCNLPGTNFIFNSQFRKLLLFMKNMFAKYVMNEGLFSNCFSIWDNLAFCSQRANVKLTFLLVYVSLYNVQI